MNWYLQALAPPCEQSREAAAMHQAQLTKPPGSLGRLESLALDFAAFQATRLPQLDAIQICIFAADHGVVEEGVSAFPQEVTAQMVQNFTSGGAAIAVLARQLRAHLQVVNMGTVAPTTDLPGVVAIDVAPGTANFTRTAAMTATQLTAAIDAGAAQVSRTTQLFIGGEMGIGNTTSAAALAACLLEVPAQQTVGRGTGVNEAGVAKKIECVERALALHAAHCRTPIDVLQRLGGFEIAALVGAYIQAAAWGIPILVDGFIAAVAAVAACHINPSVRAWMLFSHRSTEPGHALVLASLDAKPLLDLNLRLGEGSGAAVAVPLLRLACELHSGMATFASAGVSGAEQL